MRTGPCACGALLRMPDEMSLWLIPMRIHVQGEQHQLWRARRPTWQGTPRLYEEHLREVLSPPVAVSRVSAVRTPVSTSGKAA